MGSRENFGNFLCILARMFWNVPNFHNFRMEDEIIIATKEEIYEIKSKCLEALTAVNWRSDICYEDNISVPNATHYARQGHDAGLEAVLKLQPTSEDFNEWINFTGLCTVLYNRDNSPPKYTILRIVI